MIRRVLALVLLGVTLAGCLEAGTSLQAFQEQDLEPGVHTIRGTISAVGSFEGQEFLALDGAAAEDYCQGVLGQPTGRALGRDYTFTLRIEETTWNGQPGLYSPDLPCPLPGLPKAMGEVLSSVAWVRGGAFEQTQRAETKSTFEWVDQAFGEYAFDGLGLEVWQWQGTAEELQSLEDWSELFSRLFVDISDAGEGPLSDVWAAHDMAGLVELGDMDADGNFGTGDSLTLTHTGANDWSAHLLTWTGCSKCPAGPVMALHAPDGWRIESPAQGVQMRYEELGPDLGEVIFGRTIGRAIPVGDIEVVIERDGRALDVSPLSKGMGSSDAAGWRFGDKNGDGLVGPEDSFEVLVSAEEVQLGFQSKSASQVLSWIELS